MQLVEPVLHVAEGAQQVEARLAQVEPGVERVHILLALIDARLLLGCGRKLGRRAGHVAGAVAQLQLRATLFNCSLAICCFRLAISACASSSRRLRQFGDLNIVLSLCLLGLDLGAQGLGRGDLGFGANGKVEEGNRNLENQS